jgi:hypothetical protein
MSEPITNGKKNWYDIVIAILDPKVLTAAGGIILALIFALMLYDITNKKLEVYAGSRHGIHI